MMVAVHIMETETLFTDIKKTDRSCRAVLVLVADNR